MWAYLSLTENSVSETIVIDFVMCLVISRHNGYNIKGNT